MREQEEPALIKTTITTPQNQFVLSFNKKNPVSGNFNKKSLFSKNHTETPSDRKQSTSEDKGTTIN